jgi:hypothetical protein
MPTELNIPECNRIIAEFVTKGKTMRAAGGGRLYVINGIPTKIPNMKFHSSWDWIMTVVSLIKKIIDENQWPHGINVGIVPVADFYDLPIYASIDEVYKAIVHFIEWYNTQTTKTN